MLSSKATINNISVYSYVEFNTFRSILCKVDISGNSQAQPGNFQRNLKTGYTIRFFHFGHMQHIETWNEHIYHVLSILDIHTTLKS